jgi:hypothetical protein
MFVVNWSHDFRNRDIDTGLLSAVFVMSQQTTLTAFFQTRRRAPDLQAAKRRKILVEDTLQDVQVRPPDACRCTFEDAFLTQKMFKPLIDMMQEK